MTLLENLHTAVRDNCADQCAYAIRHTDLKAPLDAIWTSFEQGNTREIRERLRTDPDPKTGHFLQGILYVDRDGTTFDPGQGDNYRPSVSLAMALTVVEGSTAGNDVYRNVPVSWGTFSANIQPSTQPDYDIALKADPLPQATFDRNHDVNQALLQRYYGGKIEDYKKDENRLVAMVRHYANELGQALLDSISLTFPQPRNCFMFRLLPPFSVTYLNTHVVVSSKKVEISPDFCACIPNVPVGPQAKNAEAGYPGRAPNYAFYLPKTQLTGAVHFADFMPSVAQNKSGTWTCVDWHYEVHGDVSDVSVTFDVGDFEVDVTITWIPSGYAEAEPAVVHCPRFSAHITSDAIPFSLKLAPYVSGRSIYFTCKEATFEFPCSIHLTALGFPLDEIAEFLYGLFSKNFCHAMKNVGVAGLKLKILDLDSLFPQKPAGLIGVDTHTLGDSGIFAPFRMV